MAFVLAAGAAYAADSKETPPEAAAPAEEIPASVDGFPAARVQIMNMIAGAKQKIWLSTDYLTDGDIVSGLYLAQYRHVNVQVLLGRLKANSYMSRLNFLKEQNIPVFLKPKEFDVPYTALACDDKLLFMDGDLDFRAKVKKYNLRSGSADDRAHFEAAFAKATGDAIPAVARPIPLVGRSHGNVGPAYSGPAVPRSSAPVERRTSMRRSPDYGGEDTGAAYGYRYSDVKPPKGVPKKLPKETIWQRRERDTPAAGQAPDPAGPEPMREAESDTDNTPREETK